MQGATPQRLSSIGQEGQKRIGAGIHYRSDIVAGRALGRAVAEKVIARAQQDGS
jgi:hypothetical protein